MQLDAENDAVDDCVVALPSVGNTVEMWLRVLSVCTHNQTRSVMIGALLTEHLQRAGVQGAVRSAGIVDSDHQPTATTIRLLAARGIDVSGHRSHRIEQSDVERADLVITAEQAHVLAIAGQWPEAFDKTFTLPEAVRIGDHADHEHHTDLRSWLDALATHRPTPLDYLDADDVGEIDDPTGHAPAVWRRSFDLIDGLTAQLAALIAHNSRGDIR